MGLQYTFVFMVEGNAYMNGLYRFMLFLFLGVR